MAKKDYDAIILEAPQKRRDLFWSHVKKTDTCWLFTGALPRNKYAPFSFNYTQMHGHRASLLWATGKPAAGMQANHKCRNKHCVNPDHLYWGTSSQNMQDKIRDGACPLSGAVGEDQRHATLTNNTVRHIWIDLMDDPRNLEGIAQKYNTKSNIVSMIKAKKSWVAITDELPDLPDVHDLSKWPKFDRKARAPLSREQIAIILKMIDAKIALRKIALHTACADTTLRHIYFRERGVFPKSCVNRGAKQTVTKARGEPRHWAQAKFQAAGDISPSS